MVVVVVVVVVVVPFSAPSSALALFPFAGFSVATVGTVIEVQTSSISFSHLKTIIILRKVTVTS